VQRPTLKNRWRVANRFHDVEYAQLQLALFPVRDAEELGMVESIEELSIVSWGDASIHNLSYGSWFPQWPVLMQGSCQDAGVDFAITYANSPFDAYEIANTISSMLVG
jgi:hypothetical protein